MSMRFEARERKREREQTVDYYYRFFLGFIDLVSGWFVGWSSWSSWFDFFSSYLFSGSSSFSFSLDRWSSVVALFYIHDVRMLIDNQSFFSEPKKIANEEGEFFRFFLFFGWPNLSFSFFFQFSHIITSLIWSQDMCNDDDGRRCLGVWQCCWCM